MRQQQQTGQNDRELIVSAGGCRRAAQGVQGQSSHGSYLHAGSRGEPARGSGADGVALLTRSGSAVGEGKDLLPSPRGASPTRPGRGPPIAAATWCTSSGPPVSEPGHLAAVQPV